MGRFGTWGRALGLAGPGKQTGYRGAGGWCSKAGVSAPRAPAAERSFTDNTVMTHVNHVDTCQSCRYVSIMLIRVHHVDTSSTGHFALLLANIFTAISLFNVFVFWTVVSYWWGGGRVNLNDRKQGQHEPFSPRGNSRILWVCGCRWFTFYITFRAFIRRFYPKRLTISPFVIRSAMIYLCRCSKDVHRTKCKY